MPAAKMNELQQLPLRDIHLPEAVSWWPPAYGWWLLVVLLGACAWGAWSLVRKGVARRREVEVLRVDQDTIVVPQDGIDHVEPGSSPVSSASRSRESELMQ